MCVCSWKTHIFNLACVFNPENAILINPCKIAFSTPHPPSCLNLAIAHFPAPNRTSLIWHVFSTRKTQFWDYCTRFHHENAHFLILHAFSCWKTHISKWFNNVRFRFENAHYIPENRVFKHQNTSLIWHVFSTRKTHIPSDLTLPRFRKITTRSWAFWYVPRPCLPQVLWCPRKASW